MNKARSCLAVSVVIPMNKARNCLAASGVIPMNTARNYQVAGKWPVAARVMPVHTDRCDQELSGCFSGNTNEQR